MSFNYMEEIGTPANLEGLNHTIFLIFLTTFYIDFLKNFLSLIFSKTFVY